MDPNSPGNTPPSQNQYDFIMNPQQPQKKGRFSLPGGGNTQKKLMLILGGGIILIIISLIAVALFGGNSVNDELANIARQQQEIARVSEIGNKKAGSTRAQTIASMVKSTITSDQQKTLQYLETNGTRLSGGDLNTQRRQSTDQELDTAEKNGRFDEAFIQIIENQLEDYNNNLAAIRDNTPSRSARELVDQHITNVELIFNL